MHMVDRRVKTSLKRIINSPHEGEVRDIVSLKGEHKISGATEKLQVIDEVNSEENWIPDEEIREYHGTMDNDTAIDDIADGTNSADYNESKNSRNIQQTTYSCEEVT